MEKWRNEECVRERERARGGRRERERRGAVVLGLLACSKARPKRDAVPLGTLLVVLTFGV